MGDEARMTPRARPFTPRDLASSRPGHPLLRRQAWDEALAREEARCARHARPAAVLTIISTAPAGSRMALARAVAPLIRTSEVAAMVAPGEVSILLVESGLDDAVGLASRLIAALSEVVGPVKVGIAERGPTGLTGAWAAARVAANGASPGTVADLRRGR